MIKPTTALIAALVLAGSGSAQAASNTACNRACLSGAITAYLNGMVKHDPAAVPVAKDVRVTENIKDIKLGEGLFATATKLGTFREEFLDTRAGVAGAHVVVDEGGKPALLAVRLKVVGRKITEIESQVTRSQEEGQVWEPAGLTTANPAMTKMPKKSQLNSREEMVKITDFYSRGLIAGSFVKVDAPFAEETTSRNENGSFTAGPPCIRNPSCKNIKTQPSPTRAGFQDRVMLVDEQNGIVWRRLSWNRTNGQRLVAFEVFKVYDGKMQVVEAFLRLEPQSSTSGWG